MHLDQAPFAKMSREEGRHNKRDKKAQVAAKKAKRKADFPNDAGYRLLQAGQMTVKLEMSCYSITYVAGTNKRNTTPVSSNPWPVSSIIVSVKRLQVIYHRLHVREALKTWMQDLNLTN